MCHLGIGICSLSFPMWAENFLDLFMNYMLNIWNNRRLWVLFKSCGEYWYFCFGRHLTRLYSGHNWQPSFYALRFQYLLSFQSLCCVSQICLTYILHSSQSGVWKMSCSLSQIYTCTYTVNKQCYRVAFLISSLGSPQYFLISWDCLSARNYPILPSTSHMCDK